MPHAMATETMPVLGVYHEPLVYCLLQFVEKMPTLIPLCINRIMAAWPTTRDGNSPKVNSTLLACFVSFVVYRYCMFRCGPRAAAVRVAAA